MSLRQDAKAKFRELWSNGIFLSRRQFADRSEEIMGESIPFATVRTWSVDDGWSAALVQLGVSEELTRIYDLLEDALDMIMGSKTPEALAHSARALKFLLMTVPVEFSVEFQQRIIDVRDLLYQAMHSQRLGVMSQSIYASLMRSWAVLQPYVLTDLGADYGELDADAIIMGMSDDS